MLVTVATQSNYLTLWKTICHFLDLGQDFAYLLVI